MSSILAISLPTPTFNGCGFLSENAAGNRSHNVAMRSCEAFDISKTAPPAGPLPPRDLAHADVGWENPDTSRQITDAGQGRNADFKLDRVTIGWDGSACAARAVADAMP